MFLLFQLDVATSKLLSNFGKLLKISIWIFDILAFSPSFCPIKIDLSDNTVWQQTADFQKLVKMNNFWYF